MPPAFFSRLLNISNLQQFVFSILIELEVCKKKVSLKVVKSRYFTKNKNRIFLNFLANQIFYDEKKSIALCKQRFSIPLGQPKVTFI